MRGVILYTEGDRMALTKKGLKALMTAEAEATFEDLLGDQAEGGGMTLTAIEEAVLEAGR